MPASTLLSITGIEIGDYSVRDLTMSLEPIGASVQQDRNINGTLVDLSEEQFRKYRATIACTDHESPVFAGVWPGTIVTVTCIPHLGTNSENSAGEQEQLTLTMMVQPWSVSRQEWAAEGAWQIVLEEV